MSPGTPISNARGAYSAAAATSTAAMPTSEWKAATSSGIEVIGTRRAITAPTPPPMAMPRMTSTQATPSAGGWLASVVATAIAMPTMPNRLPWRDDAGLDSPRSDRMNRTPATRYRIAARLAFISGPHCLRHHEVHAVHSPFHLTFFLYIASMRWVTRKPPKIFTQAKISATKPKPRAHPLPLDIMGTPTASSAPTTITEEIALVTDISGVCSAGVTDQTTK